MSSELKPEQEIGPFALSLDASNGADIDHASSGYPASEVAQLAQCVKDETARQLARGSNDVYEQVLHLIEMAMIEVVMKDSGQNLTRAAQRLGISRPTLRSKIRMRMPFDKEVRDA
jgi:DNA-binding protein Fis